MTALVHVGVLAQVERGEVEAEHLDRAAQRAQPAARQARRPLARSESSIVSRSASSSSAVS